MTDPTPWERWQAASDRRRAARLMRLSRWLKQVARRARKLAKAIDPEVHP